MFHHVDKLPSIHWNTCHLKSSITCLLDYNFFYLTVCCFCAFPDYETFPSCVHCRFSSRGGHGNAGLHPPIFTARTIRPDPTDWPSIVRGTPRATITTPWPFTVTCTRTTAGLVFPTPKSRFGKPMLMASITTETAEAILWRMGMGITNSPPSIQVDMWSTKTRTCDPAIFIIKCTVVGILWESSPKCIFEGTLTWAQRIHAKYVLQRETSW